MRQQVRKTNVVAFLMTVEGQLRGWRFSRFWTSFNAIRQIVSVVARACCLCLVAMSTHSFGSDFIERPMQIHDIVEMGLQIWTEAMPEWDTELRYDGSRAVFLAQTPVLVYPPASMSIMSFQFTDKSSVDLRRLVDEAFSMGLSNYGVKNEQEILSTAVSRQYGELSGYEIAFPARVHGQEADVKVFVGQKEGHGPVLLQAYTLKGKMRHLAEVIRRSWSNIGYLSEDNQR